MNTSILVLSSFWVLFHLFLIWVSKGIKVHFCQVNMWFSAALLEFWSILVKIRCYKSVNWMFFSKSGLVCSRSLVELYFCWQHSGESKVQQPTGAMLRCSHTSLIWPLPPPPGRERCSCSGAALKAKHTNRNSEGSRYSNAPRHSSPTRRFWCTWGCLISQDPITHTKNPPDVDRGQKQNID